MITYVARERLDSLSGVNLLLEVALLEDNAKAPKTPTALPLRPDATPVLLRPPLTLSTTSPPSAREEDKAFTDAVGTLLVHQETVNYKLAELYGDVICSCSAPVNVVNLILVAICNGFRSTSPYLAMGPMALVSAVGILGKSLLVLSMRPY